MQQQFCARSLNDFRGFSNLERVFLQFCRVIGGQLDDKITDPITIRITGICVLKYGPAMAIITIMEETSFNIYAGRSNRSAIV